MNEEQYGLKTDYGITFSTTLHTIEQSHNHHSHSNPSDVPFLLKIRHPSPDHITMTTLGPEDSPQANHDSQTTTAYSDSEEMESTMEVINVDIDDVDHHYNNTEDENRNHSRPSVINLGASRRGSGTDGTPVDHTPTTGNPLDSLQHNGERPERMREWLIRMINSGRFLGLEWLNKENSVFRVPWVHAKKRDYNQERDAALFKEWAMHSGKYGDGSDVTTWKINFRCALNGLKDIIERKELEGPDCRVYEMLPPSSGRRRKRKKSIIHYSEMMQLQSMPATDHTIQRNVRPKFDLPVATGQALTLATPTDTPTTPIATTPIHLVPIVTCAANFPFSIPVATIQASPTSSTQQFTTISHNPTIMPKLRPSAIMPPSQAIRTTFMEITPNSSSDGSLPRQQPLGSSSGGSDRSVTPSSDKILETNSRIIPFSPITSPTQQCSPKPSHHDKVIIPIYPPLRSGKVCWPSSQFANNPNALTIRIMYGSITVYMDTIDCSKGCRIFYGPLHCRDVLSADEEVKLFGPLEAHQISISPRHPSPLASEIFRTLKRGLVLEVDNGDIYATALCRAVVYAGTSPVKNTKALDKEERTKVFEHSPRFLFELKHSIETRTSACPKPYTIFSFGQHWNKERSLSKNLISVVATHCKSLNKFKTHSLPIFDELLYESLENQDIRIISPTRRDLEAEEFLNPSSTPNTPR